MFEGELRFDLDTLERLSQSIGSAAEDIKTTHKQVIDTLDKLRDEWNTPAGKEFFSKVEIDWSPEVDHYVEILEALQQMLQYAISEYSDVVTEAGKLTF